MRSEIVSMPQPGGRNEEGHVLRAANRQLERAEVYLAAVAHMELDDREAMSSLNRLRTDLYSLRRYLSDRHDRT